MRKSKIVVQDEVLAKVGVALRRAAKRAREIAAWTNTPIVVMENGRVVEKKIVGKRGVTLKKAVDRHGGHPIIILSRGKSSF